MVFNQINGFNDNGRDDDEFGVKMEESIEKTPANLKENLRARHPKAPKW